MKALKVLGAGMLALSLASAAQASTVIHITGSSAFRKAVHQAIKDILNTGYTYAYTGTDITKASAANFHGTTISGSNDVIIQTSFSGSVGGVQTVSQQIAPTFKFLPVGTLGTTAGQSGLTAATISATGVITDNSQTESDVPEVCMTDAFQSSTPFFSTADAPYTAADLVENTVGVVQFKWIANNGSPASSTASTSTTTTAGSSTVVVSSTSGIVLGATATLSVSGTSQIATGAYVTAISGNNVTLSGTALFSNTGTASFTYAGLSNVTPQLAQGLYLGGNIALATFTGSGYDRTNLVTCNYQTGSHPVQVWAIGRDADSGTRINAFAESGVGTASVVFQFCPLDGSNNIIGISGSSVITTQEAYPAETLNGLSYDAGNTGYNSGGNLATAMKATNSLAAIGGYYVTYLGINDAATALAGGARELTYNGVAYSDAAVQEGQYTFWGYEHLDYLSSYSGVGKTVANLLRDQIKNVEASQSGLPISTMHVSRLVDGGLVSTNY